MISGYNEEAPPVRHLFEIVAKEIKIFGFLVWSLAPKYEEDFYENVPAKVANGEIKYVVDVTKGLKLAGHAILDVQKGKNKGKGGQVKGKGAFVADDDEDLDALLKRFRETAIEIPYPQREMRPREQRPSNGGCAAASALEALDHTH